MSLLSYYFHFQANAHNPVPRVEDLIAFTANGHNNATCVEGEPASMFNRTLSNPGQDRYFFIFTI